MRNPWIDLQDKAPYVLQEDYPIVAVYNATAPAHSKVDVTLLPEPWVGNPDAPIVLLALNPGLSPDDHKQHASKAFRDRLRRSLARAETDHHFYHLAPEQTGPGADWWRRALGGLSKECGEESVARNVVCFEFFPYHSKKFDHAHLRLPSQAFTFGLVRSALERRAWVVVTRGLKFWLGAVPGLYRYPHLISTKNRQRTSISPGNMSLAYWKNLVSAARSS